MADVKIENTSSDLNGAVLKNAATEATLKELLKAIQGMDKKSGGGSSSKGTDSVTKAQGYYQRSLTELKGTTEEQTDQVKKSTSKLKDFGGSLVDAAASITSAGLGLVFSGLVSAGKSLVGFFTDGMEALRETSSVGASFNNDIVALRKAAADANMPLDQFTAMIKQNSAMLSQFGGTVTEGATRFGKLTSEVRTSDLGTKLFGMGLTINDVNEYMGSYLDTQMRMGRLQGKTDKELIEGAQAYIQEMETMTKITGLSRKDAEEKLRSAMMEGRISYMASKLTGDALKNFQSGVLLVNTKLQPFGDSIKNAMAGIVKPGDKFAAMMAASVPGFLSFNKALGQGKLGAREQVEGYKAQAKALKNYLGRFSTEQIAANEELSKMQEYLNSINGIANSNVDAAAAEIESRSKATQLLGSLGQAFETLKNTILSAIIGSDTFDDFYKSFNDLSGTLLEFGKAFGAKIRVLMDIFKGSFLDAKEMGQSTSDALLTAISSVFKQLEPLITPITEKLADMASKAFSITVDLVFGGIKNSVRKWVGDLSIGAILGGIVGSFFGPIGTSVGIWAGAAIGGLLAKWDIDILGGLIAIGDGIKSFFVTIGDSFSKLIEALTPSNVTEKIKSVVLSIVDGFSKLFEYISPSKMIENIKTSFSIFSRGFSMFGNFITDLPLHIEKMIGKMDPTGMLVKTGVIRSAEQIDKEMAKRTAERDTAVTTPAAPNLPAGANMSQTPNAAAILPAAQNTDQQAKQAQINEQLIKVLDKLSPEQIAVLSQSSTVAAAQGAATTGNAAAQDQLNKTMVEMLEIMKQQRELSKDQVDAIKGRGSAMGPR